MRLVTIFELAVRSETGLQVMFRKASEELAQLNRTAEERANAGKSLDSIARALQRRNQPKP